MALQTTVSTAPGTLIIAPSRQEAGNRRSLQDQPQQQSQKAPQPETVLRQGNSESFASADTFRAERSAATGGSFQEHTGISAYQSLAFEARKEEIKQMMGVDTYA